MLMVMEVTVLLINVVTLSCLQLFMMFLHSIELNRHLQDEVTIVRASLSWKQHLVSEPDKIQKQLKSVSFDAVLTIFSVTSATLPPSRYTDKMSLKLVHMRSINKSALVYIMVWHQIGHVKFLCLHLSSHAKWWKLWSRWMQEWKGSTKSKRNVYQWKLNNWMKKWN